MTLRTIRPAEGRRILHPGTNRPLADAGEAVTWGSYWERALDAGDVVEVFTSAAVTAAKPTAKDGAAS
jgi:hypothetical protein